MSKITAKITSPVKDYSGSIAGVVFVKGEAQTDDSFMINWFKMKGYGIEHLEEEKNTTTRATTKK